MSVDINDYLPSNIRRAEMLCGAHLLAVERLMYDEPGEPEDEPVRLAWGPLLITSDDGRQWILDAEESKSNILILSSLDSAGPWYNERPLRIPVATASDEDPLRFLLTDDLVEVDAASREPAAGVPDSFAMCGLRITGASGRWACIGTHLGEDPYPEVAIRLPHEVSKEVRFSTICSTFGRNSV